MARKTETRNAREREENARYREALVTCRELVKDMPKGERLRAYQDCLKAMARE